MSPQRPQVRGAMFALTKRARTSAAHSTRYGRRSVVGSAGMPSFSASTRLRFRPLARIKGRELAVRGAARLRRRRPRWRGVATAHGTIRTGRAASPPARSAQGELPAPDAEDRERGVRRERRARSPLAAHDRRAREPLLNRILAATAIALLALTSASALGGSFPGRNGMIVFNREHRGNVDLYLRTRHGKIVRLTRWRGLDEYPSFSADGKRIAFGRKRSGNEDVYVMTAGGRGVRRVTRAPQDESDPTWAPDGLRLAYASFGKNDEIGAIGVDGKGAADLTNNPASDLDPAWSPDGTKIAFASNRDDPSGEVYEIYVMDADGSNQLRLTHTPGDDGEPSWSPDGTRIAFVTTSGKSADLAVMNADGSGLTTITHSGRAFEPAWSPDGTKIAFTLLRKGRGQLYWVNVDGSGLRRLTKDRDDDGAPDWQPLP